MPDKRIAAAAAALLLGSVLAAAARGPASASRSGGRPAVDSSSAPEREFREAAGTQRASSRPALRQRDLDGGPGQPLAERPGGPGLWLAAGSFALLAFLVYRWIAEDQGPPGVDR